MIPMMQYDRKRRVMITPLPPMQTFEFSRDGQTACGTVRGDHIGHAARELCGTEVALWGRVWLRERGGQWREFRVDQDSAFPA